MYGKYVFILWWCWRVFVYNTKIWLICLYFPLGFFEYILDVSTFGFCPANATPAGVSSHMSYPVSGQIWGRHAVHMSTRGVVGQVDAQQQRQHQNRQETEQKGPGSGHSHPLTARDTVALVQELVSTSRSGHVSGKSPCSWSISRKSDVYNVGCRRHWRRDVQAGSRGRWFWTTNTVKKLN